MTTTSSFSATDFNPFTVHGQVTMNAVLEAARRTEPVFHSPVLQIWVVTRADDVSAALTDPRVFSSIGALPEPRSPEVQRRLHGRVPAGATLIGWDDPEHARMRRLLQAAFTRPGLRALEPLLRERVGTLLDDLDGRDEVDVLAEVAMPTTLEVVFDLIGVPAELRADCFAWSTDWGRLHGADMEGLALEEQLRLADSAIRLHDVVSDLIAARRATPTDDLISQVIAVEAESEAPLDAQELLSLFPGLIFAGHESSAHLTVNTLARLLPRDDREALVTDSKVLGRFVDEVARLDTPFGGVVRTVTEDVTLAGQQLRAGDQVLLHFGSANRDRDAFDEPDLLDLDRHHARRHFAFGHGSHACIAAALGRMEAALICELVVRRWPDVRITHTPAPAPHFFMRGFQNLTVNPRAGRL